MQDRNDKKEMQRALETRWLDDESRLRSAEDYKPRIDPTDELSDYEARTHGDNRRI